MTTALWLGLLLGARHALDPDHVMAVSALVTRERRPGIASLLGAAWAAGHGTVLLTLALASALFGAVFPAELSSYAEAGVGGVLVVLGATNLRAVRHPPAPRAASGSLLRAGAIGCVHGLAGSGVLVVVAAAQFTTPATLAGYFLAFAVGTGLGMIACSGLLGAPLARLRGPCVRRALYALTGVASVGLGIGMLAGLNVLPSTAAALFG